MELSVVKTFPGDDSFHFFEEVIKNVYPPGQLRLKQTEGINRDFLHIAFVVLRGQLPVARCCIYNNPLLSLEGKRTLCIGNYECINDDGVAALLMQAAFTEARSLNAENIAGPMNGSTWDTYRLGVYDGSPNFFLEPYYPAYYQQQFEKAGFNKIARYVSSIDRSEQLVDERVQRTKKSFGERGILLRNIDLDHYEKELDQLYGFCMEAFRNNFLFSPIGKENFIEKYLKVRSYIKPEYVLIAENSKKEIVGFIFCLENYFDTKEKGLIIKTVAKDPSIRYGGMGNLLASTVKKKALENGYTYIIHAFMLETNVSKNISVYFSGETLREYFLYGKDL